MESIILNKEILKLEKILFNTKTACHKKSYNFNMTSDSFPQLRDRCLSPQWLAFNRLFFYFGIRGDDTTPCADSQHGGIVGVNPPGKRSKHEAVRSGLKYFMMQSARSCLEYKLHLGNEIQIFSLLYKLFKPVVGEQFLCIISLSLYLVLTARWNNSRTGVQTAILVT